MPKPQLLLTQKINMSDKSYAELADEIMNGAFSNPAKNPYDPATGHQASMPSMDPNDSLIEMSDTQRSLFMEHARAETKEEVPVNKPTSSAPTTTLELTQQDLQILSKAKSIIEKIQEATTVGNIGINLAGGQKTQNPTKVTVPGDVNVAAAPKKRVKKKAKQKANDFLHYINK